MTNPPPPPPTTISTESSSLGARNHKRNLAVRTSILTLLCGVLLLLQLPGQSTAFVLLPKTTNFNYKNYLPIIHCNNHGHRNNNELPQMILATRLQSKENDDQNDATTNINVSTDIPPEELQSQLKARLFQLLDETPANAPTSRELTESLLAVVQQLEAVCPTPDSDVLTKLGGTWELLWTTQDRSSDQYNQFLGPLRNWINPLENQSYSNNPNGAEGRLNPVLPRPLQDQLEKLGIIKTDEELANIRSSQTIDLKQGRVRNVVTFGIPGLGRSGGAMRRASLTVDVDFTPDATNPRRVNVKFQACRIVVPKTPIDVTIPLGVIGPTGWLQTNFIDDSFRITRGHKGSVFVLKRPTASS